MTNLQLSVIYNEQVEGLKEDLIDLASVNIERVN